jgi:hypothetical protein
MEGGTAVARAKEPEHNHLDISPVFGAPTRCPNCRDSDGDNEPPCPLCKGSKISHVSIKGPGATLL